ncbi:MAG TPA: ribbon-helix-helix protein, CopG family [Desulfobacterales bacterium]|nr:ribbon-helix-helix protein, CopG family [Desulfobacterales bacterium]
MKRNDLVQLRIGDAAKIDLRILAARRKISMSEMIRELIREAKIELEEKRGEE